MSNDGIKISSVNQINNVTNSENFSVVLKKRSSQEKEKNIIKSEVDDKFIDNLISKEAQSSLITMIRSKEIVLTNSDVNYINKFTNS